jgi:hypothetical protein
MELLLFIAFVAIIGAIAQLGNVDYGDLDWRAPLATS